MSHEVESMAYIQEAPWHGLGNQLPVGQSLEAWLKAAGMNWEIQEAEAKFEVKGELSRYSDAKVLYRSDNHKPLSIVSKRYKVVQPREVLEFYRDLVGAGGFELETAGVLREGRKLWALARTGQEAVLKGGDLVKGYLLLATACDGTLATTAQFTSVRVVCANTLFLAVGDSHGAVKVPHSTDFEPAEVKKQLGIGLTAWERFVVDMKALAAKPVSEGQAKRLLTEILGDPSLPPESQPKDLETAYNLFSGVGRGAELDSAKGTAWGLVNAVTEYVDHARRARSQDNRLNSAWFGMGARIKQRAYDQALSFA